jgi:hypothetical protein
MWRSFFLAIGITFVLVGVQFLGIEKVVLKMKGEPPAATSPFDTEPKPAPAVEVNPPPWAPYSMMSTGAIVCLYSFTLPKRFKQ